jgi:hypothetical protein
VGLCSIISKIYGHERIIRPLLHQRLFECRASKLNEVAQARNRRFRNEFAITFKLKQEWFNCFIRKD